MQATMKALVKKEAAKGMWMEQVPIPDQIPSELAAFFDPYGNAAHCALEFDLIGEDVLITGAGPIGIIAAGIAKHVGARNVVVTDVNDYRLKLAADMGATRVVNVSKQSVGVYCKSSFCSTVSSN